jgi:hypothetical protein
MNKINHTKFTVLSIKEDTVQVEITFSSSEKLKLDEEVILRTDKVILKQNDSVLVDYHPTQPEDLFMIDQDGKIRIIS